MSLKHLLSINDLSNKQIDELLESCRSFKELLGSLNKKVPTLRGSSIVNLFFENSTRTRTSFEYAGKRLSADVINVSASSSSVSKGESVMDTVRTLDAMKPDIIVIRHSSSGVPAFVASQLPENGASIINAGDGTHEHPTQALLDLMTITEQWGENIKGATVLIIGDISHSRVARSNILLLNKRGVNVRVCGPKTMIPCEIEKMGCKVYHHLEDALKGVDIVMPLRIQSERINDACFPSLREYSTLWGMNLKRYKMANKGAILMHPGPMIRGVEIMPDLADSEYAKVLDQVTNGVALRMSLILKLAHSKQSLFN